MSGGYNLRSKQRFDYKAFHTHGIKVPKMENLIDEESKMHLKVTRFLNDNDLDLLFGIQEIEDGIAEAKILSEKYEEIHVDLKREFLKTDHGAEEYARAYGNIEDRLKVILDWSKAARGELKRLKQEELANRQAAEDFAQAEELRLAKVKITNEEYYLRDKLNLEIDSMIAADCTFSDTIQDNIVYVKDLREKYVKILMKVDEFGADFREEFGQFDEMSLKINTFIADMLARCQQIKVNEKIERGKHEDLLACQKSDKENLEKIQSCKSLYGNISERFSNLESKCMVQVEKLTDSQVMEFNSDLKVLDSDFNDLLDRITQLGQLNPAQFSETDEYLPDLIERKKELKGSIEIYKTTLRDEITERDLSVEKLKNASSVGIKLPVFKGYESTLDYYTFKAEFEKLVVPRYSKPLLPEYLKNNYLRGQALELVKETHDLDQIWERLERSFGNVSVLLSTKLNEVDKISPLHNINNNEKLVESITKLRNCMSELKTLAGKHEIEGSLYHSSNLSKIFELIGEKRQKDITRKLIDQNKTSCEDKWDAILAHLEKEAKVCMDVALYKKAATPKEKKTGGKTGGNSSASHTAEGARDKKKCIVCQKTDHVLT
ncbi:MAG: hypothetical protein QF495_05675, partial [SAR324 cluster bacterium]|nr:hypothetical protein [SAR324 cluster bacterium]